MHTPGLDIKGDDKLLIGSRKLLEGCPRPLQSHYIEHFKGHFVLMDQVLTQTALSAVLVRTTNTNVKNKPTKSSTLESLLNDRGRLIFWSLLTETS